MIEYKEDCFAIRGTAKIKKCVALTNIKCSNCSFYKPYSQHLEDLKKYPWNEDMRRVSVDSIYKPQVKKAIKPLLFCKNRSKELLKIITIII